MDINKLIRITGALILAFGWLFIAPLEANSDDPISVAAQEIQDLKNSVKDLTYQKDFNDLIYIAEQKYNIAVQTKYDRDAAILAYDNAVTAESTALNEKTLAKSAVDGQTPIVANALTNKNNAKDALDLANINLQTAQSNLQSASGIGLAYTVYSGIRQNGQMFPNQVLCSGTWNSNYMSLPVCGNRYENFVVKFTGTITVPDHWTSTYFAGYTDDGFRMWVNGQFAIGNWQEQGVDWSAYSPVYDVSEDKTLDVEIWWYNGGGPGSYYLGWAIPGGWTGAGCDYTGGWGVGFSCNLNTFSSGSGPTQQQTDAYNDALTAQKESQKVYDDKSYIYTQEKNKLDLYNQTLTTKTTNYNTAKDSTASKLIIKNNAITAYNEAIIDMDDAIENAWDYYDKQKEREIQIAIAQAAANAAANQPTPEPTIEPTPIASPDPEPTVEPTIKPTPEVTEQPKPEVTVDPTPTPKPTIEPTVEPTPKPEISPTPEDLVKPEPTPQATKNTEIKNEKLAALIPEKGTGTSEDLSGVIANLTSKDNKLVKLSPEQIAAVSQTLKALTVEAKEEIAGNLGISAGEVAKIADQMKSNPALASAFVEFADRADNAGDTPMPFTLADAVTEVQTEAFLADPLGALFNVDPLELLSNFSELGMDMTDDQREKAQEVIIPVVIVSQIASTIIGMRR